MAENHNDGGQAFPNYSGQHPGMTMRQYYKGEVVKILEPPSVYIGEKQTASAIELWRNHVGVLADAMIAEDEEHARKENDIDLKF